MVKTYTITNTYFNKVSTCPASKNHSSGQQDTWECPVMSFRIIHSFLCPVMSFRIIHQFFCLVMSFRIIHSFFVLLSHSESFTRFLSCYVIQNHSLVYCLVMSFRIIHSVFVLLCHSESFTRFFFVFFFLFEILFVFQVILCDRVCEWWRLDVPYAEAKTTARGACQILLCRDLSGTQLPTSTRLAMFET